MASVTALLIVLTLAGQPAVDALCISWCDSPSERQACGEAIATFTSPELSQAVTTCVTLLEVAPFVRDALAEYFNKLGNVG